MEGDAACALQLLQVRLFVLCHEEPRQTGYLLKSCDAGWIEDNRGVLKGRDILLIVAAACSPGVLSIYDCVFREKFVVN